MSFELIAYDDMQDLVAMIGTVQRAECFLQDSVIEGVVSKIYFGDEFCIAEEAIRAAFVYCEIEGKGKCLLGTYHFDANIKYDEMERLFNKTMLRQKVLIITYENGDEQCIPFDLDALQYLVLIVDQVVSLRTYEVEHIVSGGER